MAREEPIARSDVGFLIPQRHKSPTNQPFEGDGRAGVDSRAPAGTDQGLKIDRITAPYLMREACPGEGFQIPTINRFRPKSRAGRVPTKTGVCHSNSRTRSSRPGQGLQGWNAAGYRAASEIWACRRGELPIMSRRRVALRFATTG